MRMMLKVSIRVEAGNPASRSGNLGKTIERILEEMKPEAVTSRKTMASGPDTSSST